MTTLKGGPTLKGVSARSLEAPQDNAASSPASPAEALIGQLKDAIAPGRGNSHWLSFKEASALLKAADGAPRKARNALMDKLGEGLNTGAIDGQPLVLGARALKLVAKFCNTSPQAYLDAAPALAAATGAAQRLNTRFESHKAPTLEGGERLSPAGAMAQTVASGLADVAAAVQTAKGDADLSSLDGVRQFANAQLDLHLADRGLNKDDAAIDLRFDRAQWKPSDFNNTRGLEDCIDQAASFLAQMAEDRGGAVRLNVQLTPKGRLERTTGTDRDTLHVPVNKGFDAAELRSEWDDGGFIRADNWWNPMDHMKAGKLRTLWKLVGNPVGVVRTRMRRVLQDAQIDLSQSLGKLLDKAGDVPLDELREKTSEVVRTFVGPEVQDRQGGNLRDALLGRVADLDEKQLVSFLGRWNDMATDAGLLEEVNEFALGATANKLRDSQVKIGLVNVDTYDTVSVAPDSVLGRHGEQATNDVELDGVRVGLVNVQSVDMVSVVPDLARMIFGGTAMEKAAEATGVLDG
jgi:hypothetical protein